MVFSSPVFLALFLPLTLLFYALAPAKARNALLLAASVVFYSWGDPRALPVMLVVIAINYLAGLTISAKPRKKLIMALAVCADFGILCVFKYLIYIIENLNAWLGFIDLPRLPLPEIALPIGISFYIFQAVSYVVDVHRGQVPAQKSLLRFALYISLFPQLIAGPIVRYDQIASELDKRRLTAANFQAGLARFITGLAKKVLIADSMGQIADAVFACPAPEVPCLWAWLGAIAYALQIYYDFSGYSDMAIGIGRVFNFTFPENFNYPYAAISLRDFWRRWHMSLTQWLRDYLYIPLGGNRGSGAKTARNIMLVLLACGLWHGASWNFVAWGAYNGAGLLCGRFLWPNLSSFLPGWIWRFFILFFVLVGWVFFRSPDLSYATEYLAIMLAGNADFSFYYLDDIWHKCLTISNGFFMFVALILSQPIVAFKSDRLCASVAGQLWLAILFCLTLAWALTSSYSPFLYFRF